MSMQTLAGHGVAHGLTDVVEPAIRGIRYDANLVYPNALPSEGQLLWASYTGYIGDAALSSAISRLGVSINLSGPPSVYEAITGLDWAAWYWRQVYQAEQERPTQVEWREIANRYAIPDATLEASWRQYGFIDAAYRAQLTNLRYDIPGPADLVRFSVRHVWEPDLVAKLGYSDEFPGKVIDFWHSCKGLDYPLFTGPFRSQIDQFVGGQGGSFALANSYAEVGISEPTWAEAYWWSHWVLPSPSQGYLMWQRLNPARNKRWDGPEMRGINFDYESLKLLLRANDYPPFYRDALAAISRPIPGIRYARQFAQNGVYSWRDLFDWTQRQGYSDGDGIDIADSIWADAQRAASKTAGCKECKTAIEAYQVGLITSADLIEQLVGFGLTAEQANLEAEKAATEIQVKRAREVVSAVRRQYLLGGLNDIRARQLLLNYGLVMDRIDQYIADWTIERQFKFREAGASKLVSWACKGLIDGASLNDRLTNLGYSEFDRQGLVAEAAYCQAELAARAAAALARQQQARARDIAKAQQEAAKAYRELAKLMAGRATPKDLRKWYCEGKVTESEVYSRLRYLSWPDTDISRLIGDCKSGKSAGSGGQG